MTKEQAPCNCIKVNPGQEDPNKLRFSCGMVTVTLTIGLRTDTAPVFRQRCRIMPTHRSPHRTSTFDPHTSEVFEEASLHCSMRLIFYGQWQCCSCCNRIHYDYELLMVFGLCSFGQTKFDRYSVRSTSQQKLNRTWCCVEQSFAASQRQSSEKPVTLFSPRGDQHNSSSSCFAAFRSLLTE